MAVGDSSQEAVRSYLAFQRESTWGALHNTAFTNATAMEFLSCNFKTDIKSEKLDTLGFRGMTKRVQLEKSVGGTVESFLHPEETTMMFGVCLGNGIVSTSLTGAYTHSITVGNITGTAPTAVSFQMKKGDTTFQYLGGRINTMKITANAGEVAKVSMDFIFKDSTIGTTDYSSSLSYSSVLPFTFVNGSYRYNATEGSLTSTVAEQIQGFELTINNNLKADASARALGTNLLTVLPPTRREVMFKIKQRFDTTTTFNRFIQGTQGSVELYFSGSAITVEHSHRMVIRLPKVFYNQADPEVGGAQDILSASIDFDVLQDTATSAGREIAVTVINNVASYTAA